MIGKLSNILMYSLIGVVLSLRLYAQVPVPEGISHGVSLNPTNEIVEERRKDIHNQYLYLQENNRFTEFLDLNTTIDFPVGIRKKIGNLEYVIAIDSVVITPTYAFLNASMSFKPPQSDEWIAFRGTNIRFTSQGGLSGDARLDLVGDYAIQIPGSRMDLVLKEEDTYVEWDCDGFKGFGLNGGVNFSREILIPINDAGEDIEGIVSGSFSVSINDWNDLIASVSITPFKLTNSPGFTFYSSEATFDFSDLRNPLDIVFPTGFDSPFVTSDNHNLWRGVFLKSVRVNLPPEFTSESSDIPYIEARNLLIDEFGLSGKFSGQYILSLEKGESGSMTGWPFSVDKFSIGFVSNKLNHCYFNGQILLPITDEKSTLDYTAFVDHQNNYFFNISPTDSLEFELWQAGQVTIYESSYINVYVRDGRFMPITSLNGQMSINAGRLGGEKVSIKEIEFENLKVSAKAPYISGGVFSTGSENDLPSLSGFDMDIEAIGLVTLPDSTIALDIEGGILLTGEKGGAFSASGGLQVAGEKTRNESRNKWNYNRTIIKKIELEADNGACYFNGSLEYFSNDRIYGNGYKGLVNAEFKPGIKAEATARFGLVNDEKYWYADALASFNNGLQIAPGLGIYGFGGGAYYGMKMIQSNQMRNSSNSGIAYVPDPEAGLGIRAALNLGAIPEPEAFNGDASFEMSFYKSGGIRNINFKGEGYFMTLPVEGGLESLKTNIEKISQFSSNREQPENLFTPTFNNVNSQAKADVTGHININYDFSNRIFHGNVEVFVDAAQGMITGTGNMNRAGWAVMHFAPDDWYIHIGTPSDRLGLKMGIGDINAISDGYFMVGSKIPASPPPNENVGRILGGIDLDYMRDENALGLGKGFAMGASLNFDTGDLEFWKFYARFMAGTGFDLMLKNYGSNASCLNRTGPIGINGWYANGQAYAYFDGKIGINVDVFGDRRKVDIINLSSAAVLQAKLPNPVWMRGIVGGYFDALGGLVKGECRFEATIGEECDIQASSAVSGIKVITEITPMSGEEDVSVFNSPQVVFNMPINEIFELTDINNRKETFRIKLDHFRLKNEEDVLTGNIEWNPNKDVAVFNAFEILPPESLIEVEVQISFEERVGGNWVPVTEKGNIIIEKDKINFRTGTAPDFIPYENISYSYPVLEMDNFYPGEYGNGYIQLKKGQAYLFEKDDRWEKKGKMVSSEGTSEFDFTYNISEKKVEFIVPKLGNDIAYDWNLVNIPIKLLGIVDDNVVSSSKSIESESGESTLEIRERSAEGALELLQESALFTSRFRTSHFDTFEDKIEAIKPNNAIRELLIEWDLHRLKSKLVSTEQFSQLEIDGNKFTDFNPLIKMEADLSKNDYYQNKIHPIIYANYPINGMATIENRDKDELGIPPIKAINIANVESNYLIYDLPRIYHQDFHEIRNKVIPLFINQPDPLPTQVKTLMFYGFPIVGEGEYEVRFNYHLPGETTPYSSRMIKMILDFSR